MSFGHLDYEEPDMVASLINISQTDRVIWLFSVPKIWLAGATTYEEPTFIRLEQWLDDWNQAAGEETFRYAGATMVNMLPGDVPRDGLITRVASHQNAFTAP